MSVDRWLDLEGAVNVRDLGGLATTDGRLVSPRVLLRSDNLQGLTEKDVAHLLGEVGLRTGLDLRPPAAAEGGGPGPPTATCVRRANPDFSPRPHPRPPPPTPRPPRPYLSLTAPDCHPPLPHVSPHTPP